MIGRHNDESFCNSHKINQQRIRYYISALVTTYLLIIIGVASISLFTSLRHSLWGIPTIFVSLLDIYFLTCSLLKEPKRIDNRFSTVIISLGATFGLGTFVVLQNPEPLNWQYMPLLNMIGEYLSLMPYPFVFWSLLCLRNCLTVIPEAHAVVAHGPYRYSRHPLYVCYATWAFADFLMFPSWFMFFASAGQIVFLYLRLQREEQLLLDVFPEYRIYYQQTMLLGRRKLS